jgi:hypothetical protein
MNLRQFSSKSLKIIQNNRILINFLIEELINLLSQLQLFFLNLQINLLKQTSHLCHSLLMILLISINIKLSITHLIININFILLQTIKNIIIKGLQIICTLLNR